MTYKLGMYDIDFNTGEFTLPGINPMKPLGNGQLALLEQLFQAGEEGVSADDLDQDQLCGLLCTLANSYNRGEIPPVFELHRYIGVNKAGNLQVFDSKKEFTQEGLEELKASFPGLVDAYDLIKDNDLKSESEPRPAPDPDPKPEAAEKAAPAPDSAEQEVSKPPQAKVSVPKPPKKTPANKPQKKATQPPAPSGVPARKPAPPKQIKRTTPTVSAIKVPNAGAPTEDDRVLKIFDRASRDLAAHDPSLSLEELANKGLQYVRIKREKPHILASLIITQARAADLEDDRNGWKSLLKQRFSRAVVDEIIDHKKRLEAANAVAADDTPAEEKDADVVEDSPQCQQKKDLEISLKDIEREIRIDDNDPIKLNMPQVKVVRALLQAFNAGIALSRENLRQVVGGKNKSDQNSNVSRAINGINKAVNPIFKKAAQVDVDFIVYNKKTRAYSLSIAPLEPEGA